MIKKEKIMQVNSVDSSTNFKMALKINPKLQSSISKRGSDFLLALDNYGKKMSDVRLYDVVFDESINTPKIFRFNENTARDFFAELKNEEKNLGRYYEIPAGFYGDTRSGFYPDEPKVFLKLYGKQAKAKYNEFKKFNIYEQAENYCRMLEELDVKQMRAQKKEESLNRVNEILKKEKQKKLNRTAEDLIEKYRYEKPAEFVNTVQTKPDKKSWWKRIFS